MASGRTRGPAKLPKQQLIILAICRFAEPVAMTSVYPYLPEMIQSFNVPKEQVAWYAGLLSLVFSGSQALVAISWGRASDVVGRKPMVMIALTCTMLSSIVFGFSTSLPMAFVTRSLQGLSNGNVGIIRTAVAELVPQKELQPRAFSIMPLVWTVGSIFGPTFGGTLVHPVERYPQLFGKIKLLKEYPFAFPNLVISALFLIGILSGLLFFRETLEEKKDRRDYGLMLGSLMTRSCTPRSKKSTWHPRHQRVVTPGGVSDDEEESAPFLNPGESSVPPSPLERHKTASESTQPPAKATADWNQVFTRQSNLNLLVYTVLAMHSAAFDQLLPVFLHHYPVQPIRSPGVHLPFHFSGGFELDSARIGAIFTVNSIFGMVVQFAIFPPMVRRLGVLNCFKACAIVFPLTYIATPYISLLPTDDQRQGVILALTLVKGLCCIFAFPCVTILLTNSAASLKVLGTLNGVATSISALGRAAGPALSGAMFTIGVDNNLVVLPWFTLGAIGIIGAIPIWWLVEMDGFGGGTDDDGIKIGSDTDSDDYGGEDSALLEEEEDQPANDPIKGMTTAVRKGSASEIGLRVSPVDERDDNLPALVQTVSRGSAGRHLRRESFGMRRVSTSPIGMGPRGVASGSARRYSTDLGTTMSGFGTGGTI